MNKLAFRGICITLFIILLLSTYTLAGVDVRVGPTFEGTTTYLQIQLKPTIDLGNFHARLNLNLGVTYNATMGMNFCILNKSFDDIFDYVKYRGDLFWGFNGELDYGSLDNIFIDYGLLTDRYSTLGEKGFFGDIRWRGIAGFTTLFHPNPATSTSLLGIRAYIQPFSNLLVGGTYITDTSTSASITAVGADIAMELARNSSYLYFEWGKILDYGWGISTGILFRFGDGGLFRLMYRYDSDEFVGSYFDSTYELNKAEKRSSLATAISKQGIFGEFSYSNPANPITFYLEYINYSEQKPYMIGGLSLKFGKLLGNIYYVHKELDFSNFQFIDKNTILTANMKFYILSSLYASVDYKDTYSYDPDEEKYTRVSNWSTGIGIEF